MGCENIYNISNSLTLFLITLGEFYNAKLNEGRVRGFVQFKT